MSGHQRSHCTSRLEREVKLTCLIFEFSFGSMYVCSRSRCRSRRRTSSCTVSSLSTCCASHKGTNTVMILEELASRISMELFDRAQFSTRLYESSSGHVLLLAATPRNLVVILGQRFNEAQLALACSDLIISLSVVLSRVLDEQVAQPSAFLRHQAKAEDPVPSISR